MVYYRKKTPPSIGIFPEVLKKEFGVEYDRKKDTQYTLYLKLLKLDKKDKDTNNDTEDIENWLDNDTDQEQDCEGTSDSLLGDPDDPDSVAWLLQQILNFSATNKTLMLINSH